MPIQKKFLFILTSHNLLGNTKEKTGFHYNEMAEPYYLLQDHSIEVDLASVQGGEPPADPSSLRKNLQENPENVRRFMNDKSAMSKLKSTLHINNISIDNYVGLYLPGGHGTMWDFPNNITLKKIIEKAWVDQKIIAAVCHGSAALVNVRDKNGIPLVKGQRVNCYTDEEEKRSGKDKFVPFLLERRLRELGAIIEKSPPNHPCIVQDSYFITGQNSKSAALVAQAILHSLKIFPDYESEEKKYATPHILREAVGVFAEQKNLDATVAELEGTAFPRHDISVLGNEKKTDDYYTVKASSDNLIDDPEAPRTISVRPEEKTIGTAALIGCCAYICGTFFVITSGSTSTLGIIGTITAGSFLGALIGVATSLLIWKKYNLLLRDRLEKGGLVLWVKTPDPEKERLAQQIMCKHGGRRVHVHEII